jgi:hypothetical protein
VKLTTLFYLVSTLRMGATMTPQPYDFLIHKDKDKGKGKSKFKVETRTGHEGPEEE